MEKKKRQEDVVKGKVMRVMEILKIQEEEMREREREEMDTGINTKEKKRMRELRHNENKHVEE